jgi:hypothetical protein
MYISEPSALTSLLVLAAFTMLAHTAELKCTFYQTIQPPLSPLPSLPHNPRKITFGKLNDQPGSELACCPQVPDDDTTVWKACGSKEQFMSREQPVTQCYPFKENGISSCSSAFTNVTGLERADSWELSGYTVTKVKLSSQIKNSPST